MEMGGIYEETRVSRKNGRLWWKNGRFRGKMRFSWVFGQEIGKK